jgi:hypothetical protein
MDEFDKWNNIKKKTSIGKIKENDFIELKKRLKRIIFD